MNAIVRHNVDVPTQKLSAAVTRKVLSYNKDMMLVEVHYEAGGVGSAHSHPHMQATYVKRGSFLFNIGGEDVVAKEGDSILFEPNVVHGTLCVEAGTLLDVFSPMREDLI